MHYFSAPYDILQYQPSQSSAKPALILTPYLSAKSLCDESLSASAHLISSLAYPNVSQNEDWQKVIGTIENTIKIVKNV